MAGDSIQGWFSRRSYRAGSAVTQGKIRQSRGEMNMLNDFLSQSRAF
jgi:hypothetical protein